MECEDNSRQFRTGKPDKGMQFKEKWQMGCERADEEHESKNTPNCVFVIKVIGLFHSSIF